MANKNFTDFTLKTPPANNDFLVGYNADGSAEFRTTLRSLASASFTNAFQHYYTVYVDKLGNDSTARVGNPFYPFRTPQTAYASLSYLAGLGFPCVIKFSPGNFEGISIAADWPSHFSIQGAGPEATFIAAISSQPLDYQEVGSTRTYGINLIGDFSYTVGTVEVGQGIDSFFGSNTVDAGQITLKNVLVNRVIQGTAWGPLSNAGNILIDNCRIGSGGIATGYGEEQGISLQLKDSLVSGNVSINGSAVGSGSVVINNSEITGSTILEPNAQTLTIKNSIMNGLTAKDSQSAPNSPVYIYNSVLGNVYLGDSSEYPGNTNYFWHSMFKSLTNVSGLSAGNYNSVNALIN